MTITAAADGSALGNPGPAGWAWYVDDECWRAGGWPHGTNNMGELMAVLDLFRSTSHLQAEHLHILCDSQYVINCVTKWMPGWKRKGWKKSDGKPVLNVDLLKQIDDVIKGRDYSFEWVRGHAGHELNEAADVRARAAATAFQGRRPADEGPGFAGAATRAPATPADQGAQRVVVETDREAPRAGAEQDDLFSELEDVRETGTGSADIDAVVTLERELLEPAVRSEVGQLNYLLHPGYREIAADGTLRDKDSSIAVLASLEAGGGPSGTAGRFELLASEVVGTDVVQLAYRLSGARGTAVVGSAWQRDAGRWRLRFRQETPES
ncbi:RNase H family protein [Arthrobacter sp. KK5.5]|uniref:RNase H family protein n=1 Tax=Arthrobacter sp. KK5.5 TaxID=3373084 RepID=UPI003EE719F2